MPSSTFSIADLRGGVNNSDSPTLLPANQVVDARNIDFREGVLGSKRRGTIPVALDGSVFERAVPVLAATAKGGVNGGTSFDITVPAVSDDGTGNSYVILVLKVNTKPDTAVSSASLGGNALSALTNTAFNNAGRVTVLYLQSPALEGGTLTVNLAGSCDAAGIVEVWTRTDQIALIDSATGTSQFPNDTVTASPAIIITDAVGWQSSTALATGIGGTQTDQHTEDTARVAGSYRIGTSPVSQMVWVLGASGDWIQITSSLRGRPIEPGDVNITTLLRHTPTNNPANDELWAQDSHGRLDRRVGGSWQGGVPVVNQFLGSHAIAASPFNGVSLHGKFFLSAQGILDRTFVWDGSVLRWAGIAAPSVPSVGNTGSAGSYTGTRYFRIRYTEQKNGVTVRRSEPSTAVPFTPSGSNSGAVITKPSGTEAFTAPTMEGQTHWEVEASTDNILFYRIATVAVGTSTYTDTTAFSTGYSGSPLSESIGEYVPPPCVRHVAVDEDRVIMAGARFSEAQDSTVFWTPVSADDGVGSDERIPATTRNFINLDGLDGGRITALLAGVAGNVYVFKASRIYKLVRTGVLASAYDPITESHARGALDFAAVAGTDPDGVPCAYFLDPDVGLCRIGARGVERLATSIRKTWKSRNRTVTPHIVFHPGLEQVWYWVALDEETAPNRLFVHEARYGSNLYHDGVLAQGLASTIFSVSGELKPFIGISSLVVTGGGIALVLQCDTGTTDAGTPYRAYVTTKPYTLGNLWTKFGLMAAALLAKAASGTTLAMELIRNFGVETRSVTVDLTPVGSEQHVVKPLDNASMSELNTVQITYGDPEANDSEWSVDQIVFKVRSEEGTAGG